MIEMLSGSVRRSLVLYRCLAMRGQLADALRGLQGMATTNAAAEGKHAKAIQGFWQELVRTYRQGCWRAHRWASARLARQCLQCGLPHEAAWYAVAALDDDLAKQAAKGLLDRRDVVAVRGV